MKVGEICREGKVIKRYKRFLCDIELDDGEMITAHTPNTGSMKTCWEPGWKALVSFHDDPKRKLKYTLEMTHNGESWIGVNTSKTNHIAKEAIENGTVKELQGYSLLKTEKKVGKSRIDLYLEYPGSSPDEEPLECYVEVKNVTLKDFSSEQSLATFPDSVTTRGQKHLRELIELKEKGCRAVMLFIVNRQDVEVFSPAAEIDPTYASLLKAAKDHGVEILAYQCELAPESVAATKAIPVKL